MNIAEILRGLADKLDGIGAEGGAEVPHQNQSAQLHQADAVNDENPDVNTDSMVSPLQQKLELLKKAAGVDNAYDDGELGDEEVSDCGCEQGEEDPLDAMKKMAGLPVVVQMTGDDNDIEG